MGLCRASLRTLSGTPHLRLQGPRLSHHLRRFLWNVRSPPRGCPDLINVKFMPFVSLPHTVYCLISNYQTPPASPIPNTWFAFSTLPASPAAAASDQPAHLSAAGAERAQPEKARAGVELPAADTASGGLFGGVRGLCKLQYSSCILAIRPNLLRQEVQMSPNWFHFLCFAISSGNGRSRLLLVTCMLEHCSFWD